MANLLGSSGIDILTGTDYSDSMYGNDGNDRLSGGKGNDYLVGGYGNDVLTGGSGADVFVFNNLYEGIDTIKDFKWYEGDTIQINSFGFGASSPYEFYYNSSTGALDHLGIQFATLQPNLSFNVGTEITLV